MFVIIPLLCYIISLISLTDTNSVSKIHRPVTKRSLDLLLNHYQQFGQSVGQFQPIVQNGSFGKMFNGFVSRDQVLIFVFPYDKKVQPPTTPRVTVKSVQAVKPRSLQVVVTQQQSILSWQIPLETESPNGIFTYNSVSRTLCPEDDDDDIDDTKDIIVTLGSPSSYRVDFSLSVNLTDDFDIKPSHIYNISVTPSKPQFFRFMFGEDMNSALLHVESADPACMTLSIQNNSCPVYDLERTIQYRGLWQTVTSKGGIFLRKSEFPRGMFIVFVVHSTDRDCVAHPTINQYVTKTVSFQLEKSIDYWDYVWGISVVLVAFLVIYLLAGCFILYSNRRMQSCESPLEEPLIHSSDVGCSFATTPTTPVTDVGSSSGSTSGTVGDYNEGESVKITKSITLLFLSDLAQKDPHELSLKSKMYMWNMVIVAVFYALPVVQLVFSYQQVSIDSGNQDLCYYNFLCSHRLGYWSDFNHVFSNSGYLLFGLLFLILTWRRQRLNCRVGSHLGIPYHFGMFYALGFALFMEGVLSACYHLCPNHSNFQFDTSFMYVIATLSMMKIYQTRHPDITASAYTTFGALAFIIFLGMFGVLNGSEWFYVLFTVAHLVICLIITAQLYHEGNWKLGFGSFCETFKENYHNGGLKNCLMPEYPTRMLLLTLANFGNWAMVAMGYYLQLGDFATYMLYIFLANLLMYFIFYIAMKVVCKEKILPLAWIYIVLAFLFWGGGLYFFSHKSISWKKTPAESRAYNQPCVILNFYDKHDIWHFLSAGAIFFSFMVLLTLDDDIAERDRREISVF